MIFWIVSMFCLCMDYNRLNHPSKSKCLSVQTQCTGLVSHGMLVTLVTFIYRFVCCDMSALLDRVLQWQREEVSEKKRCVYITGMLLHFVRFSFLLWLFFFFHLSFVALGSRHRNTANTESQPERDTASACKRCSTKADPVSSKFDIFCTSVKYMRK